MPGCFKKTLFALASLISFVSFILIVVAMGTPKWMTGKILCKTGADLVNATDPELVKFIGEIYYGLFRGGKIRQCGLGGRRSKFTISTITLSCHDQIICLKFMVTSTNFLGGLFGLWVFCQLCSTVFPHMVKKLNTGLHVIIVMFLCVAILFSLISVGFCILNAIKVPYRAINGPAGACLWNFLAGGFVVLAVTSFMAAVKLHHLTERIANFRENVFRFVILEEHFEECFWICVASATAHAVNLLLIAISGIHFPKIKTKTEEVNVTAEDIMY